jgi:plasmid maintenance system antidote protein VapI
MDKEQNLDDILQGKLKSQIDISPKEAVSDMLQLSEKISGIINEKLKVSSAKIITLSMYVNYCEKLYSQFRDDEDYRALFCNEYFYWKQQLDLLSLRADEDIQIDVPMLRRIINNMYNTST